MCVVGGSPRIPVAALAPTPDLNPVWHHRKHLPPTPEYLSRRSYCAFSRGGIDPQHVAQRCPRYPTLRDRSHKKTFSITWNFVVCINL